MGATTAVSNASWTPSTTPGNTTITLNLTTTLGLNTATIASCNAVLITNNAAISGPNVPVGTFISGGVCGAGTVLLNQVATVTGTALHTFTMPAYVAPFPPSVAGVPSGLNCSVCPALFSTNICSGQYVNYYMCPGNVYTISLCGSIAAWNSTLSITSSTFNPVAGFSLSDDDGCGAPSQHATFTFVPISPLTYRIRVFNNNAGNPCTINGGLCGTINITCSPSPAPPVNDNPCASVGLTVGAVCNFTSTTTSWATSSNPPIAPTCGAYAGYDTWYTATVPLSGAMAIQTQLAGATDLAMAVYTAPACNSASGLWVQQFCNDDISAGIPNPFISFNSLPLAGQTVYIRVWPQSGGSNGGSFQICAYEPTPPPNDNPCAAEPVPVTAGCIVVGATNQDATPTGGVPAPSCGIVGTYNDVWFTVQIPAAPVGVGVIINTGSAILNDAAMAVYTAGACGGPFTQVGCSDPAGSAMPSLQVNQNGGTIVAGTVLYVRVWNKTAVFGNFTVCATPTVPPANNEPCGAIPLPLNYGCLYSGYTNSNASTTPVTFGGQHLSVPTPSCPGPGPVTATNDVWFTVQVPNPFGGVNNIVIDSDDGSLSNAAMAVYRVVSGNCTGSLTLTELACQPGGSTNNPAMPVITLSGATLSPGEVLYVRVWREGGTDGTFLLCARRTDPPVGDCSYTLRMNDSAGDGWNGSFVTVCVGVVCTDYSTIGGTGTITFPANNAQSVTVSYTAVGGFQNQISYQILASNGGVMFNSGATPAQGLVFAFTVNGLCNVPPAPQEDCIGAHHVCSSSAVASNPLNTGGVADLNISNRGCLITNEHMGVWFTFQVSAPGQLGFTVNPFPYGSSDYDYGLWGPYPTITCPPNTLPLRCSWADGPSLTGLNWVATDVSESAGGDSWTQYVTVATGQWYVLFVDNWYYTGTGFDLTFQGSPGCGVGANPPCSSVDCVLPVEFLAFTGKVDGTAVALEWSTASESNSSHFVVERSTDGSNFVPLGNVGAAGNSTSLRQYEYTDRNPALGMNYYRLQQVDRDARTVWSNTVAVNYRSVRIPVRVYPNPANDLLEVNFDLAVEGYQSWRIMDASGRIVATGRMPVSEGPNRHTIPVDRLEQGSYVLEMQDERGTVLGNARFVKQ